MYINDLKNMDEAQIRKEVRAILQESYKTKEELDEISFSGLKSAGKHIIDKAKEKGREVQTAYREGDLKGKLEKTGIEFRKFLDKDLKPLLDKINKRQKQLGKKEVSLKSMLTTMANKYGK